jgi:hypothetical protein
MTRVETAAESDEGFPLRLRVMGVTIDARAPDALMLERLSEQWGRALVADDVAADSLVPGPRAVPGGTDTVHRRDYGFATLVTLAALQATAGRRVNLHAGSLADDAGRVLVLVAPSGTGKTTATRALATRLHYLSDETASITPDGIVFAHPKPLSVVIDPEDVTHKEQLSPDELGFGSTPDSGRLHRIVVLRRGPTSTPGLHRLDPLSALMELIEQSSSLPEVDSPLTTLHHLVESAGGVMLLEYEEITEHLDALVDQLAAPASQEPEPEGLVRHPGPAVTGVDHGVDVGGDLVYRLPWTDALELDHELVILMASRAVRLADIPATLWLRLTEPMTVPELVAAAEETHGHHPGAEDIVRGSLEALVREGLVVVGSLA